MVKNCPPESVQRFRAAIETAKSAFANIEGTRRRNEAVHGRVAQVDAEAARAFAAIPEDPTDAELVPYFTLLDRRAFLLTVASGEESRKLAAANQLVSALHRMLDCAEEISHIIEGRMLLRKYEKAMITAHSAPSIAPELLAICETIGGRELRPLAEADEAQLLAGNVRPDRLLALYQYCLAENAACPPQPAF